jgi:hypothetical protein
MQARILLLVSTSSFFGPALDADQGHEAHGTQVFADVAAVRPVAHPHEVLGAGIGPDGDHQPAANRELSEQRRGNLGSARRHHDAIEWRWIGQPQGAIASRAWASRASDSCRSMA